MGVVISESGPSAVWGSGQSSLAGPKECASLFASRLGSAGWKNLEREVRVLTFEPVPESQSQAGISKASAAPPPRNPPHTAQWIWAPSFQEEPSSPSPSAGGGGACEREGNGIEP